MASPHDSNSPRYRKPKNRRPQNPITSPQIPRRSTCITARTSPLKAKTPPPRQNSKAKIPTTASQIHSRRSSARRWRAHEPSRNKLYSPPPNPSTHGGALAVRKQTKTDARVREEEPEKNYSPRRTSVRRTAGQIRRARNPSTHGGALAVRKATKSDARVREEEPEKKYSPRPNLRSPDRRPNPARWKTLARNRLCLRRESRER